MTWAGCAAVELTAMASAVSAAVALVALLPSAIRVDFGVIVRALLAGLGGCGLRCVCARWLGLMVLPATGAAGSASYDGCASTNT